MLVLPKSIIKAIEDNGTKMTSSIYESVCDAMTSMHKRAGKCWLPGVILLISVSATMSLLIFLLILTLISLLILLTPIGLLAYSSSIVSGKAIIPKTASFVRKEEASDLTCLQHAPSLKKTRLEEDHVFFEKYPQFTYRAVKDSLRLAKGVLSFKLSDGVQLKGSFGRTEVEYLIKSILILDRDIYPLNHLNLDNCALYDDDLNLLLPLMVHFRKVSLNGGQMIGKDGTGSWKLLADKVIKSAKEGILKLEHLELRLMPTGTSKHARFQTKLCADSLMEVGRCFYLLKSVDLTGMTTFRREIVPPGRASGGVVANEARHLYAKFKAIFSLEELCLANCGIDGDLLESTGDDNGERSIGSQLVRMRKVVLNNNPIGNKGCTVLRKNVLAAHEGGFLKLTTLSLALDPKPPRNVFSIGDDGMNELMKLALHLTELDVSGHDKVVWGKVNIGQAQLTKFEFGGLF